MINTLVLTSFLLTIDSNDHDITDAIPKKEGEEMMPTIDIEDEEVGEDGIELESEYERMMMEFNKSDEDEDDDTSRKWNIRP
jgi:hypothetical protein